MTPLAVKKRSKGGFGLARSAWSNHITLHGKTARNPGSPKPNLHT